MIILPKKNDLFCVCGRALNDDETLCPACKNHRDRMIKQIIIATIFMGLLATWFIK